MPIGFGVWIRERRRCGRWMERVGDGLAFAHIMAKARPDSSAGEELTEVEEPQTEPVVEERPQGKPLEEATYAKLQEIAKALGLKYGGVKKADLIAGIRAARAGQLETVEVDLAEASDNTEAEELTT